MTSMRIVHVTKRYAPSVGGVESLVQTLAHGARDEGCEVEVLTHDHTGDLPVIEVIDGVVVRRFPEVVRGQHFDVSTAMWRYLARHRERYDLVHSHSYHASPALGSALRWTGPLVFSPYYHGTGHSVLRAGAHLGYRQVARVVFGRADRIVCLTPAEAELVRAAYPRVAHRVQVIPAPVEVDELRAARDCVDLDRITPTIFTAGRLVDYKRVDRLVEAFARCGPEWRLRIAGDGPERGSLEQLAAKLGVADRVELLGFVSRAELIAGYAHASVFASLSEHESQGISAVEALAAGLPVVLSDIDAHRDVGVMSGQELDFVGPSMSPQALASLLTSVRVPVDAASRQALLDGLPSPSSVIGSMMEVYRQAMGTAGRITSIGDRRPTASLASIA